jgi:CTP:molybdopterin cytidylyltransferase MocA
VSDKNQLNWFSALRNHYDPVCQGKAVSGRFIEPLEAAIVRERNGAQALLRRNPNRVVRMPFARAASDIDTPDDLIALNRVEL